MEALKQGSDVLFILLGGIMVLAMHAGFAFLELGTVRKKNQVNALVKILADFSVSTVVYFILGYGVAYGTSFFVGAEQLAARNGYELVKFFFLLTFAAAIPAIISGGIAERARFWPQLAATAILVGIVYPLFEGVAWNHAFGVQDWIKAATGEEFHDFAGSVVVHAMGGWLALPAVILLGARSNRYRKDGAMFVVMFTLTQNRWKIDDVLGVWPLHGLCGAWGGVAAGIFGAKAFGGLGGVSFSAQLLGTAMGIAWALTSGFAVYGAIRAISGLRLSPEEEHEGADLAIHRIGSTPEREATW